MIEKTDTTPWWQRDWDVIIVGSGFAGLAASIEAAKAGGRVLVLEKMRTPGGNSIIDEGMLSIALSPQQTKHHIRDSADLLASDMLENGEHLNDPEKVRYIAEESQALYEWTVKELGVQWLQHVTWAGGHSVPRTLTVRTGCGKEIYDKIYAYATKLGVCVVLSTFVERIARNGRKVEGVWIQRNYDFAKRQGDAPEFLAAKRGVILTYGGFAADVHYRLGVNEQLDQTYGTTNHAGATGELWRESERIGCLMMQANQIQCTPWTNPKEEGMGRSWLFSDYVGADIGLWVDTEGHRFVNELGNRKFAARAVFDVHRKGLRALAIGNRASKEKLDAMRPGFMDEMVALGFIEKYETIARIESAWGIPQGALVARIDRYNGFLRKKRDRDFMRPFQTFTPLTRGPWFVAEMHPKVHHCMGGLITNIRGECLDRETNQPIQGLYAAGECAGGVHGACRMGSCAILDCFVMGRTAGREAMRDH